MKKIFSLTSATILFGILFLASCAKDDPAPETPLGGDSRVGFHGNWTINEKSSDLGTVPAYYVTITDSSSASQILFAYLYGFNKKTYATVSGNSFIIPAQIIQGQSVTGNGTLTNANRIDMKYLVQSTTTHYDTVTAVLTK